jgi:hypothetical protein
VDCEMLVELQGASVAGMWVEIHFASLVPYTEVSSLHAQQGR